MFEKEPRLTVKGLLIALLKGKFHKASDSEMQGFAGCEGEGWIWDYKVGCIVVDLMGDHMIAQIFEEDHCWEFDPENRCFNQLL